MEASEEQREGQRDVLLELLLENSDWSCAIETVGGIGWVVVGGLEVYGTGSDLQGPLLK